MGTIASWWYCTRSTKLLIMFNWKKKRKGTPKAPRAKRFKTLRDAYDVTKSVKPWIGSALIAIFVVIWVGGIAIGALLGHPA